MIDLIVPPIILILIVAILITILARATKNSSELDANVVVKNNEAGGTIKDKFFNLLNLIKDRFSGIVESFEKIASKRYLLSKKYENEDANTDPKICIIDDTNSNSKLDDIKDISKKVEYDNISGKNRRIVGDIIAEPLKETKKDSESNKKVIDFEEDSLEESYHDSVMISDNHEKSDVMVDDIDEDFVDYRERYFVEQIQANPRNLTSYQQLGDYYMEINKFKEARESFEYVLKIDPQNVHAKESLERLDKINLD